MSVLSDLEATRSTLAEANDARIAALGVQLSPVTPSAIRLDALVDFLYGAYQLDEHGVPVKTSHERMEFEVAVQLQWSKFLDGLAGAVELAKSEETRKRLMEGVAVEVPRSVMNGHGTVPA